MSDFLTSLFIDPFAFPFMQRAMFAAILTGAVCAVLSCFLVLKGWSLMGDAISHAVLPGIVLAFVMGIPLIIGAFISGLFCAFATGYLKEHSRIKEDTVMGIVFSGMFALGLVLFTRIDTEQHLTHILFGNILGITQAELRQTLIIAGLTMVVLMVKYKDFMLYCFDPNQARVIGLPAVITAGTDHRRLSPGGRDYSGDRHAYFSGYHRLPAVPQLRQNDPGGDSGLCQLQLYRHCRQLPYRRRHRCLYCSCAGTLFCAGTDL